MTIQIKKLHSSATFKKVHKNDEGYDLTGCRYTYKKEGLYYIYLGIACDSPKNVYFELVPRSSFCKTPFIFTGCIGVIDRDYRGEWLFPIRNLLYPFWCELDENSVFTEIYKEKIIEPAINKYLIGKRIAQAIPRLIFDCGKPEWVTELSNTKRGSAGLGSTGE